jgi:SulP family sulfate permease
MADLPHVRRLLTIAPMTDRALLLVTFVLTVFVDLVVAVNVGVVLAALLFMRRMSEAVNVEEQVFDGDDDVRLPRNVLVYRIDGPFFFGAAEKLENTLERVQLGIDTVVIRLGRVPFMDVTGIATLSEIVRRFQKHHVRVMLCGIHAAIEPSLASSGIRAQIGEDNICTSMDDVARKTGTVPVS